MSYLQRRSTFRTLMHRLPAWICLIAGGILSARAGDLSALVPADTLMFIQVRDVPALMDKYGESPFNRFYNDPQARDFLKPLRERIEDLKKNMLARDGIPAEQFEKFFSGGFALAALPVPGDDEDPFEWVMIFEHNGDQAILDRFRQGPRLKDTKVERRAEDGAALPYSTLRLIKEEDAKIPAKQKERPMGERPGVTESIPGAIPAKKQKVRAWHQYFGDKVVIHAGREGRPIERVLALLARPDAGGSLGALADRGRLLKETDSGQDFEMFFNLARLAPYFEHDGNEALKNFGGGMSGLKMGELRAGLLNGYFRRDRLALEGRVLSSAAREGAARLLFLPAGTPEPPAALLPAETLQFSTTRVALPRAWPILWQLFGGAAPMLQMTAAGQIQSFNQASGLDFERDLIGSLGDQFTCFTLPAETNQKNDDAVHYMVKLADSAAFSKTLAAFLLHGQRTLALYNTEQDVVNGWPLFTLREGLLNPAQLGQSPRHDEAWHLLVTNQWLLAGPRREVLTRAAEQLAKPGEGALEQRAAWRRVAAELPAERTSEGFADLSGFYSRLAATVLGPIEDKLGRKNKKGDRELFNDKALPPRKVFDRHFGPTGTARGNEGDVFRWSMFELYPDKR